MENRISAYLSSDSLQGSGESSSQPGHAPAGASDPRRVGHVVRGADLYEAARARAMFDCELAKLFNPEGMGE